MRIFRCHIENFGKLQDRTFVFTDPITWICEENGWGKSTLAAFLRVMFYGLEGDRRRNIEENERKRWQPWQGGVFGGQLTFETEGRQYVISRIFRDKEANDEFELRDAVTNRLSSDYSCRIGEELFQISRDSFLRTIFISQNSLATAATEDIQARIGRLTEMDSDGGHFESANRYLTEQLNELTPKRSTGTLARLQSQITTLERQVREGSSLENHIRQYESLLAQEQRELHRWQEEERSLLRQQEQRLRQQEQAVRIQEQRARRQEQQRKQAVWQQLCDMTALREQEFEEKGKPFPDAVPDLAELDQQIARGHTLQMQKARMEKYRTAEKEKRQWDRLARTFAQGIPSEEEIQGMLVKERELSFLRRELSVQEAAMADRQSSWQREQEALEKWEEESAELADGGQEQEEAGEVRSLRRAGTIFLCAGALFILAGAGLLWQAGLLSGTSVIAAGGMICCVGGWLRSRGMRRSVSRAESDPGRKRRDRYQSWIEQERGLAELQKWSGQDRKQTEKQDQTEAKVKQTEKQGQTEAAERQTEQENRREQLRDSELACRRQQRDQKRKLLEQTAGEIAELQEEWEQKKRQADERSEALQVYLDRYALYGGEDSYRDLLFELKNRVSVYQQGKKEQDAYHRVWQEYQSTKTALEAYLIRYGFQPKAEELVSQLYEIRRALVEYEHAETLYREALSRQDAYLEELGPEREVLITSAGQRKDLPEEEADQALVTAVGRQKELPGDEEAGKARITAVDRLKDLTGEETAGEAGWTPGVQLPTVQGLQDRIRQAREQIEGIQKTLAGYRDRLNSLQENLEEWNEQKADLEAKKEEQERLSRKYRLLEQTKTLLTEAKESLTNRYAGPVYRQFCEYYEIISGESASSYRLDANLTMTVEAYGKQRVTGTLSDGYQDLAGLAFRLALVGAMYQKELPFLILDDPFTNLDEEKTRAGLRLLRQVSGQYQILYFTCTPARVGGEEFSHNT